jgi:hypothetical protein
MKYPGVKLPPKKRDQILDEVYEIIEKKGIWIPFGEVKNIITAGSLLLFVVIGNSYRTRIKISALSNLPII